MQCKTAQTCPNETLTKFAEKKKTKRKERRTKEKTIAIPPTKPEKKKRYTKSSTSRDTTKYQSEVTKQIRRTPDGIASRWTCHHYTSSKQTNAYIQNSIEFRLVIVSEDREIDNENTRKDIQVINDTVQHRSIYG